MLLVGHFLPSAPTPRRGPASNQEKPQEEGAWGAGALGWAQQVTRPAPGPGWREVRSAACCVCLLISRVLKRKDQEGTFRGRARPLTR